MNSVLEKLKSGAYWVLVLSFIAGPVSLLRNWLFSYGDPEGILIGDFAIIMIVYNIIISFLIYGGSPVLTTFIPKIEEEKDRISFLYSYTLISAGVALVLLSVPFFFPEILPWLTNNKLQTQSVIYLFALTPVVFFSQILIYYLQGALDFKYAAILNQVPIFFVSLVMLLIILLDIPMNSLAFQNSYLLFLFLLFFIVSIFILVISLMRIKAHFALFSFRFYLPDDFWSFSIYIHFITILTFCYQNIDQLFILKNTSIQQLGIYFIIIQLVEVVRYVPLKISQVILSSFSKIIHLQDEILLKEAYQKISYFVIIINLILSSVLIYGGKYILQIYKISDSLYLSALIYLVIGYNIGSLGNLNSMILLAKNKSKAFFYNNTIVIIAQLLLTLLLGKYMLLGVVWAKVIAIIVGQVGLFSLTSRLVSSALKVDSNYWVSQFLIFVMASVVLFFELSNIYMLVALFVLTNSFICWYYKISVKRILLLLNLKK